MSISGRRHIKEKSAQHLPLGHQEHNYIFNHTTPVFVIVYDNGVEKVSYKTGRTRMNKIVEAVIGFVRKRTQKSRLYASESER